jgi:tetratricopeptide (TPR) repeat protein
MGHALGVATILEGSVRKSGTRVRISVQLVKVSDGFPLWSETYDRSLDDIFAVQDDIARSVVKELRSALLGEIADSKASGEVKAEIAIAARGRSSNPEAYRLYLQACHLHDRGGAGVAKALECLNQAVALDPGFAIAWVQMANAHIQQAGLGLADLNEGYERAREALERALSIEPEMPEALRFVAKLQMLREWDWSGAEATLQRITDLKSAQSVSAELARVYGRFDEAIVILRKSLQRDPLSSPLYHNLGGALFRAGRFADAEEVYRKALSLSPGRSRTHAYLSLTLLHDGRGEEGLAEAAKEPHEAFRLWAEAIIQQVLHGREASDEPLRRLIEKYGDTALRQIADVYAIREEWTPAFEWLERAYTLRDPGLLELKGSPMLRRLHGDPRWQALLKKMRLEN